jgi:hypothetical protein
VSALWRVAWPNGNGTLWAHHNTEQQALADAERIVAGGASRVVVYEIEEVA